MKAKMRKKNKGFTLVELLVVIAIIGILAAALVPSYLSYVEHARKSNVLSEAKSALPLYEKMVLVDQVAVPPTFSNAETKDPNKIEVYHLTLAQMELDGSSLTNELHLNQDGRFFKFIVEETSIASNKFKVIGYVYGNSRYLVEYHAKTKTFTDVVPVQ